MNGFGYGGFAASVAAALTVALASAGGVARAATANWYVAPGGSDANSCAAPVDPCATMNGAIAKASAGDTIEVATGSYTGSGSEVVLVGKDLTLEGGWNSTFDSQNGVSIVDGQDTRLGVRVVDADVWIERFVVENGRNSVDTGEPSHSYAGGILVSGGELHLDASTVRNNHWGGIWSSAPVTVTNSTLDGNTGRHGSGGAITSNGAPLAITNSTISGNSANYGGGVLVLTNLSAPTAVQLSNVTIVGNSATAGDNPGEGVGGGVRINDNVTLHMRNSIVAGNTATLVDPNVSPDGPSVVSLGYNIGTGFEPAAGDIETSDPRVGLLADNGGPTDTRAPFVDSPAVDGGNPDGCVDESGLALVTDQRGVPRPQRYACDIGAFEAEPPANDDFADATSLDALPSPFSDSNEFATKEPGEPDHAADAGGASIWYSWTPSFNGMAFVTTAGSSFDTLLGVYTGASVASLTTLASNDDATLPTTTSKACFPAVAGTPYRVAVDGYAAEQGSVTLEWGQYTSDDPCAVLPPTISGTPQVGGTLTTTAGTWAGVLSGFGYQWIKCDALTCFEIVGATAHVYTPPPGTEGLQLLVRVTANPSDPAQDAIGYSALTAPVVAAAPPPPPPASPLPAPPPAPPPPPPPAPPRGPSVRCHVPAVKGKLLRVARKRILAARCRVGRIRYVRSTRAKGIVLAQRPRARRVLPRGSRVNLVVSRGRRP